MRPAADFETTATAAVALLLVLPLWRATGDLTVALVVSLTAAAWIVTSAAMS